MRTRRRKLNFERQKIGRLFVIEYREELQKWLCLCDCGNFVLIKSGNLSPNKKGGNTKSCGCLLKEKTTQRSFRHGHQVRGKTTRVYKSWCGMKERCLNPNKQDWCDYGGRGIKVCDRWLNSFENFLLDMGEPPEKHSLDRIDCNGNYTPENCRWASAKTQSCNRRNNVYLTLDKCTKKLIEWQEIYPYLTSGLYQNRKRRGWSDERIITTLPASRKTQEPSK